jgi:Ras GTPase-activating-like protein IQGAP2/3
MEEGLRNGVVFARLARVWEGDAVVRRIFEVRDEPFCDDINLIVRRPQHPKLQYRHSDNINHFLTFVRRVGLPEVYFPF